MRLLTKRKQFTVILIILLAFPAAALATGRGGGTNDGPQVGQAEVAPIAVLRAPAARFHRLVRRIIERQEAQA